MTEQKIARFLLIAFLWFIGSIVINNTSLKPQGFKSRTLSYLFLGIITFGIYHIVACIFNLVFDPSQDKNIGYFKE